MATEKFPIEASHIMMFARAVGDDNKIYYDDDYAKRTEPGSVVAPPTFVQASAQFDPDYRLRPKALAGVDRDLKHVPASALGLQSFMGLHVGFRKF